METVTTELLMNVVEGCAFRALPDIIPSSAIKNRVLRFPHFTDEEIKPKVGNADDQGCKDF